MIYVKLTAQNHAGEADILVDVGYDDTVLKTFILFVRSVRAALKYADTHFYREANLSVSKFIVLLALATNGNSMTPSEIAVCTHTERHNITTLVDRLKQGGLVGTKRNNRDKRSVIIMLTDKGREVLSQAMPVAKEIVHQVMVSIDEGDAVLLEKLLRVLRQNAYQGLENVNKHSQSKPGKVITSRPSN